MSENQWWQTEKNDGVATKPEVWRPLSRAMGGFDLDPASGCEPTPIAEGRYTEEYNGLEQPWYGNVWLNPPFSNKEAWYKRLVSQYNAGNVDRAIAIGQAGTDTQWFHEWFTTADKICFIEGRDCYIQNGTENFASMLGVWNPTEDCKAVLERFGAVMQPERDTEQTTL